MIVSKPSLRRMFPALRLFMFLTILVSLLTSVAWSSRPNVLFIAVDDLNDWVGFLDGHPQIKTPNMDRLAQRGVAFANAHCAAPLCCPSRAAVFSGQQPFTTGVYHNGPNICKLHPNKVLMPQYFAQHGYRTYGTGKLLHHSSEGLYDELFQARAALESTVGQGTGCLHERGTAHQDDQSAACR